MYKDKGAWSIRAFFPRPEVIVKLTDDDDNDDSGDDVACMCMH